MATHILQCQNEFADLVFEAAESGKVLNWTFPKASQPGDRAWLYAGEYGVFGRASILSEAVPADEQGWTGRYGGEVGGFSILEYYVPLEYLRAEVSELGWARYPRSYTTLDPSVAKLVEAAVKAYQEDSLDVERDDVEPAIEGARRLVYVNSYERSRTARKEAIRIHGSQCSACEMDFATVYGSDFSGIIHIHHLRPLSEIGENYEVDPRNDLVPVCPNCHAVIHSAKVPLTIAEVQELLRSKKEEQYEVQ